MRSRFREHRARIEARLRESSMPWAPSSTTLNANPTGINQYTHAAAQAHDASIIAERYNTVPTHRTAEVAHRVAWEHAGKLGMNNMVTLHEAKAREHDQSAEAASAGASKHEDNPHKLYKPFVAKLLYGER